MKRTKISVKLIVIAMVIYASINLINLRSRIDTAQLELDDVRREVAEMELINAELEYEIDHYYDTDVIAGIARSRLGLILPGEILLYDGSNTQLQGSD